MSKTAGSGKILVAAPGSTAKQLCDILAIEGYSACEACTGGAQALERAAAQEISVVIATHRLGDMTGAELIGRIGGGVEAILILPQYEAADDSLPESVVVMHNPINKDVFLQTVHVLVRMSRRMGQLRREVERLEGLLSERKLIDRAKGRLMEEQHMSEADAHHYMQKRSMDSGKRIAEIAREILQAQAVC